MRWGYYKLNASHRKLGCPQALRPLQGHDKQPRAMELFTQLTDGRTYTCTHIVQA
jgi:hypothetical protein